MPNPDSLSSDKQRIFSQFCRLLLVVGLNCAVSVAFAQTDTIEAEGLRGREKKQFAVGLGLQHGFIFAHSQDVQNTRGARPTGAEVILSWQSNDAPTYDLCNCYPRQGLLLAYYNYEVGLLGKSLTAAYFLEPAYRITGRLLFSFKGSAGISYLTNPYHPISNPANQSYSTTISGYLLAGTGFWYKLGENWWLNPSVNYQHISNGGMRKPNKGINWPTAGLAISYQTESRPFYRGSRTTAKAWRDQAFRYDLGIFGNIRRGSDEWGERKRFPMAGLQLLASRQVARLHAVTVGAELYQDNELRNQLRKDQENASPVKAGVMAGHEFLLGSFIFGQQLGVYIFDQTPYFDRLYHRWGLTYRFTHNLGLGFNLLAHRQVAEFIDFRLTYSFRERQL